MHRSLGLLLLGLAPVLGGWSSCDQTLTRDPSFDDWCGASLCSWRTDVGEARKVPTWHRDDFGVELAGDPAQISQRVEGGGYDTPACLAFDTMTDLGADASVTLALDFGDDGLLDYQAPLPATHWEAVRFQVTPPSWYPSVRVVLRKTGGARAVVAHMRVLAGSDCSAPPIAFTGRPLAAPCQQDAECVSQRCADGVFPYVKAGASGAAMDTCGACQAASDCAAGQTCGVAIDAQGMHTGCRPAAMARLGDRCLHDAECASGTCCGGVCSACCGDGSCGGQACAPVVRAADQGLPWLLAPSLCAPGQGRGAAGAPCLADGDCQSHACHGSGALKVCWFDGRRCQTVADCGGSGSFAGTVTGDSCVPLGVDDGRCQ